MEWVETTGKTIDEVYWKFPLAAALQPHDERR